MSPVEEAGLDEYRTYSVGGRPMIFLGSRDDRCFGPINIWARVDADGRWYRYECRAGRLYVDEVSSL